MQEIAQSLAAQMTLAGITPENVKNHPAYFDDTHMGGTGMLRYAMDDDDQPVLGDHACSLTQDGADWLLWDNWGAKSVRITHVIDWANNSRWIA